MTAIYLAALVVTILVIAWAIFSKKVKDRFWLIGGLLFIQFGCIASLLQALVGWHVSEAAAKAITFGICICSMRCFYIKEIKPRKRKNKLCKY